MALSIGLIGGCGGDDASTDAPTTTSTVVTTTAPTDPPSTEPPTTTSAGPDLPEWASGELVTVETDTGPLELPVELVPFCESSRSFYIAARGLAYVGEGQVGTAQQLFAALAALAPLAVTAAPSEELAAQPRAAQEQVAVLIEAFDEAGYDGAGLSDLPDPELVRTTFTEFGETRDSLQDFLVGVCGADVDVLDEQAQGAAAAAASAAGEADEPAEPVEPVAGTLITNRNESIEVSVPLDWTETEESAPNGHIQLVASSNIDTFYGLATPGVLVLRGEGGFRDGGFVGRVLEFELDLENVGCVLTDQLDYDDGTYIGQERIYDCGTDGLEVRLFGGTTADESLYAMVFLVAPVDEPGIRQLIVNSFFVS